MPRGYPGRIARTHPGHQVAHAAYPLWAMPARAEATHRRWQDPDNLEAIFGSTDPRIQRVSAGRRAYHGITARRAAGWSL